MLQSWNSTSSHSYFIPMVDMLAGVVFILMIMLAAVSLVSRDSFPQIEGMQQELKRIQEQLVAARAMQQRYIEPQRLADKALRLLLERLEGALRAQGIEATAEPEEGALLLQLSAAFASQAVALEPRGITLAAVLATLLKQELPCIAPGLPAEPAVCAAYPLARLGRAIVSITSATEAADFSEGRALSFLSNMVRFQPELLALQARDRDHLFRYAGAQSKQLYSDDQSAALLMKLLFRMDVPEIPATNTGLHGG